MRIQGQKSLTITAEWLRKWDLLKPIKNPTHRAGIPANMEYLRLLATDCAYIVPLGQTESIKAFKRRIYNTMYTLLRVKTDLHDMRITRLWPDTDWATVWRSIQAAPVPGTTKAMWYRVIHGIIITIERLHTIRMATTDRCRNCDKIDTLQHRLTECGDGTIVWGWTRYRIAITLRTVPRRIPLLLRPQFRMWPPKRHRAVLWVLAYLVVYRSQQRPAMTLHEYLHFIHRSKMEEAPDTEPDSTRWQISQHHRSYYVTTLVSG